MKRINLFAVPAALFLAVLVLGAPAYDYLTCTKVFDGDTILLSDGQKVRLIGVDTPEFKHPSKSTEYYTKEATMFTTKLVENKKVRLEYDKEQKDSYGRVLAYVYLENGTFVNAEIIKNGFGYVLDSYPFKHMSEFKLHESQARERKAGLWKGRGEFELKWIMKQGRHPVKIYTMSNNMWGLEYDKFIKPRVQTSGLPDELMNISRWIVELSKRDLAMKLTANGWVEK